MGKTHRTVPNKINQSRTRDDPKQNQSRTQTSEFIKHFDGAEITSNIKAGCKNIKETKLQKLGLERPDPSPNGLVSAEYIRPLGI